MFTKFLSTCALPVFGALLHVFVTLQMRDFRAACSSSVRQTEKRASVLRRSRPIFNSAILDSAVGAQIKPFATLSEMCSCTILQATFKSEECAATRRAFAARRPSSSVIAVCLFASYSKSAGARQGRTAVLVEPINMDGRR
eukprot:2888249-Pleurochrysis_carterae.AAC.15